MIMQSIKILTCVSFRHFIKEELPRIQYANPELKINVKMIENPPIRWGELWRSEMQLEFSMYL